MPSVVWLCSCSSLTTLQIGGTEEGFRCKSFSLLLHASGSLAANCCCLKSKSTVAGLSPYSLISAPRRVVGSAPRIDLSSRLRRSWRSYRLPACLGSHQSSPLYSATGGRHATWITLTFSGTMPYLSVRVRSLPSAALACFIPQLCCSLNVKSASIQMPRQRVAWVLNFMTPLPTLLFAVSDARRCFLWPRLRVNRAPYILAVSNCSPRLLPQSMLYTAHFPSIETM